MFKSFKARISITFFLSTLLIAVFFFAALYTRAESVQIEELRQYLKHTAALGANFLSGDDILKVPLQPGCEKSQIRQALVKDLKKITEIDDRIEDAYVLIPGPKDNIFHFVANADQETSATACGEPYDVSPYPAIEKALKAPEADQKITTDKWGRWLSGYAPIHDYLGNTIGVLGIDVAAKTVEELQHAYLERFIIVMMLALLMALLIGILSSQWLARPIEQIIDGMERVSEGNLHYYLKNLPQVEFNRIVEIFNKMTVSLKNIMDQLTSSVRERERIDHELEIAADLQQRALPERPPQVDDLDIAAKSIPAKEVGGDYYDFLVTDPKKVGFVIADATGKGFSGTLFMTNSRSVFRVISTEETDPSRTLSRTNDIISSDAASSKGMFITFLYSVYDRATKKLTCANAGHYPPIICEGKTRKFKTLHNGGLPLGVYPGEHFPEETVQLSSGDTVVMYTDGVIEASNRKKDMFGLTRLMKLVEDNPREDASALLAKIEKDLKEFTAGEPPFDDVTVVIFRVK